MKNSLLFPPGCESKNTRLVVALSGGADSLGLLFLLRSQWPQPSKNLIVAHVNYGLRGKDSQKDEAVVRQICKEWGLLFRRLKIKNLKKMADKKKKSLQDLAREIRYTYFGKLARREGAWAVAVAHHREDQAETVLDRLLRGAGTRGLSGLRPIQYLRFSVDAEPLRVWRPLLAFSKKDIQGILEEQGLSWREDKSNQKSRYRRNQIRREIIPYLSQWNPNIVQTLARIGEISSAEDQTLESFLALAVSRLRGRWGRKIYRCDLLSFKNMPLALQRRWVRQVCEKLNPHARGLSFERIDEIIKIWDEREKGPRDLGFGLVAGTAPKDGFIRWTGSSKPLSMG